MNRTRLAISVFPICLWVLTGIGKNLLFRLTFRPKKDWAGIEMSNSSKEIGAIEKNPNTRIVVSLTEFKGRTYVDIREHIATESYSGPTKKGLRLDVEFFEDFLEVLKTAQKEIGKEK